MRPFFRVTLRAVHLCLGLALASLAGVSSSYADEYIGGGNAGLLKGDLPANWTISSQDPALGAGNGASTGMYSPILVARAPRGGGSFVSVAKVERTGGMSYLAGRSISSLALLLGAKEVSQNTIGLRANENFAQDPRVPTSAPRGGNIRVSLSLLSTVEERGALLIQIQYPHSADGDEDSLGYIVYLYAGEDAESAEETKSLMESLDINGVNVGKSILEASAWTDYMNSASRGMPLAVRGESSTSGRVSSAGRPVSSSTNNNVNPASFPDISSMGELVQKHQNSLVLFEGKLGAGSGFVVKGPDGDLVYTNTHVVAADQGLKIRTMNGTKVNVGAAEAAVDHDEMRFKLADGMASFATLEMLENLNDTIKVGDEIAVLGNSEGAGVVRPLGGRIDGIGPDRIEISARFIPGNSGSPVIHIPTGKVIGIATYIMVHDTSFDEGSSSSNGRRDFRRFAYRLDSVKEWQPVNWPVFYKQSAELIRSEELTQNVYRLVMSMSQRNVNGPDGADDPLLRPVVAEFSRAMSGSQRASESDRKAAVGRLFAGLRSACDKELGPARPQGYYDFFIDGFETQRNARKELVSNFDDVLGELGRY